MKSAIILFLFCIEYGNAHLRLTNPVPRSSSDNLTSGPCGGVSAKTPISFDVGTMMGVKVGSTDGHTGTLSINLLNSAQQSISSLASRSANGASSYTMNVVFNQQCTNCVVQAILKTSGTTWYSCSDITVKPAVVIVPDEEPDEEDIIPTDEEESDDNIDEEGEAEPDDDESSNNSTSKKRDLLVEYISIIAACVVIVLTCLFLIFRRHRMNRTRNSRSTR